MNYETLCYQKSLRMGPRVRTSIILRPTLLVSKPVRERLTRTQAPCRVLPARSATVICHLEVLLNLTSRNIMHNHIARRPTTRLEPELGLRRTGARHTFAKASGCCRSCRYGRWGRG